MRFQIAATAIVLALAGASMTSAKAVNLYRSQAPSGSALQQVSSKGGN